jgi:hypothetical protein
MPDKKKTRVNQRRLHMNGSAWSPVALHIAHSIIRTYGSVEIAELPAPLPRLIEFKLHPALQAWSDEQLKLQSQKQA